MAVVDCWNEIMDRHDVPRGLVRFSEYAEILNAYAEPQRHYHDLTHIGQVLDVLTSVRHAARSWAPLVLAAIYHDVVYAPSQNDNEERSADFAEHAMRRLGFDDTLIARVRELILITKRHDAPDDDSDAWLLLGADLSVLALPIDRYDAYRSAIRLEYGWVPEADFCNGRRRILEGFLQRPHIFRSPHLSHLEQQARANIASEIAVLGTSGFPA